MNLQVATYPKAGAFGLALWVFTFQDTGSIERGWRNHFACLGASSSTLSPLLPLSHLLAVGRIRIIQRGES
jgi:hypothetical protein